MKKIIIIEEGLSLYNKTGVGQYTINLYNFLIEMGYQVNMKRKPFLEKIKNSTIKRILYILWLNFVFPFLICNKNSNTIIFTNTITPIFKIPGKKYYPVLHDLWAYKAPDTVSFVQKLYTKIVIFSIKIVYEKIITVSETVKNEIIDFFNCSENDVKVVYNYFSFGENPQIEMSENEQQKMLNKYGIESKKYILSVATLNKRKNIPMLIDAYNQLNNIEHKLVLVGGASSEKFNTNNENIIFTGYIKDEELKVLYKNAELYVFPSIYEGFGIPIIDAQAFGIPVLCSNIPIFREVSGNGALFCELDFKSFSNSLRKILKDEHLRKHLILEGRTNLERFNIDNIKKQLTHI